MRWTWWSGRWFWCGEEMSEECRKVTILTVIFTVHALAFVYLWKVGWPI